MSARARRVDSYLLRIYRHGVASAELVGTVQSASGGPRVVFHGTEDLWRWLRSQPQTGEQPGQPGAAGEKPVGDKNP